MTAVLALLLGVLVVLAITAATGYFVAQEFSYMAVDRASLRAQAAAGDDAAERTLRVTRRTSFMLSGAQLGITVTGLVVGYVAEPLIGDSVGTLLGGVAVPHGVGIAIGTVIALLFSTFVQMIFGELFPKNLAIARPEPVARALSRSTLLYLTVTGWLIRVFDAASNGLLRLLRIEPVHDVEHAASARDLERIVADSRVSGDLPATLSILLDRVLDFPTESVRHAMVPRTRVDAVTEATPVHELVGAMHTGHSRYPVLDADGAVTGVVHLVDVLDAMDATKIAGDLARKPFLIPTSMLLPVALRTMSAAGEQLACVLDEYGGFVGVVTLEDLAEEIVGELTDEHDTDAPPVITRADGGWRSPGDAHLDEVARALEVELPAGDYETIGGLAIAVHGGFPAVGDVVRVPLGPSPEDLVLDEPPRRRLDICIDDVAAHVPARVTLRLRTEAAT